MHNHLRLIIDNSCRSGVAPRPEKPRVKINPLRLAQRTDLLLYDGAVGELSERPPVAHPAGKHVELPGHFERAAKGIDDFVNSHGLRRYSSRLNKSSGLKLEKRPGLNSAIIARMDAARNQQLNLRSVEAIAARLVALRMAYGMAQSAFAGAAGIAANTYNQYERAISRPELDKAMLICDRFQVTLDWLYRGETAGLPYQTIERLRGATA